MQTEPTIADILSDHWSRLSKIAAVDEFWDQACVAFADLGFDQAIYATNEAVGAPADRNVRLRTSANLNAWADDYHAASDAKADPMFTYGVRLPGTIFTGSDHLGDYDYLAEAERQVIARAGDHGFRSGIAVPMLFPRPGVIGGWNLGCSDGRKETTALATRIEGLLPAFATLVQSRLEQLDIADPSPLSAREREVLLWLGRGLRTDQIAHRLDVKPVTVSLHLKNARAKLGARTREQALALAIAKNWIDP